MVIKYSFEKINYLCVSFRGAMEQYLKISLVLCVFGFIKEIRPSEPFIFEFLSGPWRNVTEDQVMQEVYPVGTYSYLIQVLVIFFITDLCRYKPLIIVLGCAGIIVYGMLLWTYTLLELQIGQVIVCHHISGK